MTAATDTRSYSERDAEQIARGVGWFSLGLGLFQLAVPGGVARMIGLEGDGRTRWAMRAIGVRGIANGLGLLTERQPVGWAWRRVGGDLLDFALLGKALGSGPAHRDRAAAATAAIVGVTLIDVVASRKLGESADAEGRRPAVHAVRAITVNRPVEAVYRFWRDLENLPRFMTHLLSVRAIDDRRSHWEAKAPIGLTVEWDAEIVEDRAGELIAWRSLPGADVPNSGAVQFSRAPGNRGTEVRVELRYDPPGGQLGAMAAKLFGQEPAQQVEGDLRRFKQVMELGEVVRSDASIHHGSHPARPPATPL